MGDAYPTLTDKHLDFIKAQRLFFVATAPRADEGRVNLSPKGYDSLIIKDPKTVLWADLGGSGVETIAHLKENGRITLMFCAFEGAANILRIYGRGEAISFGEEGYAELAAQFPQFDRTRAIIRIHVERVSDSCGWGVPFYEYKGEREQLQRWVENKPVDEWIERRYQKNAASIDGLPGLSRPAERPE